MQHQPGEHAERCATSLDPAQQQQFRRLSGFRPEWQHRGRRAAGSDERRRCRRQQCGRQDECERPPLPQRTRQGGGPDGQQARGSPLRGPSRRVRRRCTALAVVWRIGAGVVERVQLRQRCDVGGGKVQIGPAIGGRILPGECHQPGVLLHAEPLHPSNTGGQAEQRSPGAAARLQDARAGPCRDRGCQQHRLDAAAEASLGLGILHPAIEEMAASQVVMHVDHNPMVRGVVPPCHPVLASRQHRSRSRTWIG